MSTATEMAEFILLWEAVQEVQFSETLMRSLGNGQQMAGTLLSQLMRFSLREATAISTVRRFGKRRQKVNIVFFYLVASSGKDSNGG